MKLAIMYLLVNEVLKARTTSNGTEQLIGASVVCADGRAFNLTDPQLNHQCRINGVRTYDNRVQNLASYHKLAAILRNGVADVETTPHKKDEEYTTSEGELKQYTKDWIEERIVSLSPREVVANQQALSALKAIESDWKSAPIELSGLTPIGGVE